MALRRFAEINDSNHPQLSLHRLDWAEADAEVNENECNEDSNSPLTLPSSTVESRFS